MNNKKKSLLQRLNGNNLSGKGPLCRQGVVNSSFKISISGNVGQHTRFYSVAHDWTPHRGLRPEPPSLKFKGGDAFSPPDGWVVAGVNCHWRVRGTLNLLSSDLNVGGNIEAHWSDSNNAALPACIQKGERGYFAPWQQVTSIWNCQQTLIDLPKHVGCDVGGSAAWRESWAFSGTGAALAGCQLTWLIGND